MKLPKFLQLKPKDELISYSNESQIIELCRHQWKERTQSYAPPREEMNLDTHDADLLSTLLLGVTTIIDECLLCHELRKTSMLGNPNPQLDQILNNVLKYGPQYLQHSGHTFAFQEYIPPRQQINATDAFGIPIR